MGSTNFYDNFMITDIELKPLSESEAKTNNIANLDYDDDQSNNNNAFTYDEADIDLLSFINDCPTNPLPATNLASLGVLETPVNNIAITPASQVIGTRVADVGYTLLPQAQPAASTLSNIVLLNTGGISVQQNPQPSTFRGAALVNVKQEEGEAIPSTSGVPPATPTPPPPQQRSRKGKSNRPRAKPNKSSPQYMNRREKNNIAVRKSREKTKQKNVETEQRVQHLSTENSALHTRVEQLNQELHVLRNLFSTAAAAQIQQQENASTGDNNNTQQQQQ